MQINRLLFYTKKTVIHVAAILDFEFDFSDELLLFPVSESNSDDSTNMEFKLLTKTAAWDLTKVLYRKTETKNIQQQIHRQHGINLGKGAISNTKKASLKTIGKHECQSPKAKLKDGLLVMI